MPKINKFKFVLSSVIIILTTGTLRAQMKVGDNPTSINSNSVLEIESTNKALLLPRLNLASTTSFSPLTAHVSGMVVYNTATAGDVTPGYYYNDGSRWVRIFGVSAANNTTAANLIAITNGTGATLTAMTVGVDTTALKSFLNNKIQVATAAPLTGNGTSASPLGVTQNNTTAASLITITNGTGASFTAMTVGVDTAALKTFLAGKVAVVANAPLSGAGTTASPLTITTGDLTAGSLLQTTGTPTTALLKTAGLQVDTTALKTFLSNKVTSSTTAPITGDGTSANPIGVARATATSGVLTTVTNGTNAAFTALKYDVDTTALKSFLSNKVISSTTAPITGDGTAANPIGVTRATATSGVLTTVTNGTNATFTALKYDVDTTALKTFVNIPANGVSVGGPPPATTGSPSFFYDPANLDIYYRDMNGNIQKWWFYGATNGLTFFNNKYELGGTLTKPTTITTSATNTLALAGLQPTTSDTIVMTTGTGIVRNTTAGSLFGKYGEWVDGDTISKTGLIYARQALKVGSADTLAVHDNGTISMGTTQSNGALYINGASSATALHQLANYSGGSTVVRKSIMDAGTQQDIFFIRNDYDGTSMHEKLVFNYRAGGSGNPYVSRGQIGIVDNSYINTIAGNFGVGTTSPSNKLHVSALSNPLRLDGLQNGAITDSVLTVNSTGVVRKLSAASLPVSKTRAVVTTAATSFTIPDTADVVIYNGTANTSFTLPAASASYGRELRILNYAAAATNTTITLSTTIIIEGNTAPETETVINSKDTTADFPAGIASRNINTITLISNGTSWYKLGN